MDLLTGRPIRERHDRHVRRVRLSVAAGAPRHRLAFAIEEALRLLSLPGEDQGRTYYFRRLQVAGLPPDGDRGAWLDNFQRGLEKQARQAVHGMDVRAGFAEAVFFRSDQEALGTLLHRMLSRRTAQEWFWPMVAAGGGESASASPSIRDVVEGLRAQPASWVAVAAALFAEPGFDSVRLIHAFPSATVREWLGELGQAAGPHSRSVAAGSSPEAPRFAQPALPWALRAFSLDHPGVLWLAALAVLLDSPSDLAAGTVVRRARAGLLRLAGEQLRQIGANGAGTSEPASVLMPPDVLPAEAAQASALAKPALPPSALRPANAATAPVRNAGEDLEVPAGEATRVSSDGNSPSLARSAAGQGGESDTPANLLGTSADGVGGNYRDPFAQAPRADETNLQPPESESGAVPLPWLVQGSPTHAGGLFFLLNAMRCVGMAEALASGLAIPNFAPRVLRSLAAHARVATDDPVLLWLDSLLADSPALPLHLSVETSWWPANLRSSPRISTVEDLVRIWSIAVRRWCWRSAGVSVRQIVARGGVFAVNRTDLDVSLPIDAADVLVRKAGLDLDPGWLLWFGRVVRFHYLFPGEFHA